MFTLAARSSRIRYFTSYFGEMFFLKCYHADDLHFELVTSCKGCISPNDSRLRTSKVRKVNLLFIITAPKADLNFFALTRIFHLKNAFLSFNFTHFAFQAVKCDLEVPIAA